MSKKKGHGFSAEVFRNKQKRIVGKRMKGVDALYAVLADKVVRAMGGCDYDAEKDGDFSFSLYPGIEKKIDGLLNGFIVQMTDNINEGISESWGNGNAMNDALVSEIVSGARGMGAHIPRDTVNMWKQRNNDALAEFMMRKVNGMGLSGRVWDLTKQLKEELELALEVGIGDGKSAASLSRDVRGSLREPKRLFRRVRDKETGELRLSKAAAAYHPGRGKYRSSYKNALRMTATENNMAYRSADYERRKQIPFILGVEVHTSDNHPDEDICDSLKGVYPKDFKFTGWHPWCRCYTTSLLPSYEELMKYMEDGTIPDGVIKDLPDNFNDWVKENEERIADAKSLPYFLRDNGKIVDGKWEWKRPTADAVGTEVKGGRLSKDTNGNIKDYERYKNDDDYGDVRYDENSGGVIAVHRNHKYSKTGNYFGGLTGGDLEREVTEQLFHEGHVLELCEEKKRIMKDGVLEELAALDMILDGRRMDIASITKGKNYGWQLIKKNDQLERYQKRVDVFDEPNSLLLYFHEPTMYDYNKLVNQSIPFYKEHRHKDGTIITQYIHNIYVKLRGQKGMIKIDL